MAKLILRLHGKQVSEFHLDPEKTYTAGRKEDCDILLQPEKGISREHFHIICQENVWKMEVLSRFGDVIYDGQRVESLELRGTVQFQIPPYEFEFIEIETAGSQALTTTSEPQIASEEAPFPAQEVIIQDEKTFVGQSVKSFIGVLKILDPGNNIKKEIQLQPEQIYLAGRESNSQIQIEDQRVSRRQFEITSINGTYHLTDLGSVNGTVVNDQLVHPHEPMPLKSGDVIRVLENNFLFELHDPQFQALLQEAQANLPMEMEAPSSPYMAPYPEPQASPPQLVSLMQKIDFKKNKLRIVIAVLGIFLIFGFLFQSNDETENPKKALVNAADPLAKLNPEQQLIVKHHYQLAEDYLAQQKWMLAKGEIEKIKELIPNYEEYQRTKELEAHAEQGIINEREIEKIEDQQERMALQEQKIRLQVDECRSLIRPEVKREEIENCIQPVLQFNPEHPEIQKLRFDADQIITQRLIAEEQKRNLDRQANQLRQMYASAERLEKSKDYIKAIRAYENVKDSSLPDRGDYKAKATRQVRELRSQMDAKTKSYLSEAEKQAQEMNYKAAIMALREAKKIDPTNDEIDDKIESYTSQLRKMMQVLYQEGILEEGFGNVEGGEGKPGAKDKWKKILELDIPEGVYYKKARQRLRKYGVF